MGATPLLSLAICKPAIRRTAQPGDHILGLTSRILEQRDGYPALGVIYAATVSRVEDAKVYYAETSPFRSRPDCIYRYDAEAGALLHNRHTGLHADPRHRRRDLGREGIFENGRILLCDDFVYRGVEAFVLTERYSRLRGMVSALGQGHRVLADGKDQTLDGELEHLGRKLSRCVRRYTPEVVHADSYDHPAPSPADLRRFASLAC